MGIKAFVNIKKNSQWIWRLRRGCRLLWFREIAFEWMREKIIDENSTCCLPFRRSEKKIPSNYMLYSLLSRYPMPSSSYLKTCILLSLSLSLTLESRTLVELRMELLSSSVALLLLNDIIVGDIDEQEENWVSLRAILEKFILFSRTLNFHLMLTTTPKTRTMTK